MTMKFKYSYYDNGIYVISNEEVSNLTQVEITQDFLGEYEYYITRHTKCASTKNVGLAVYNELMALPEVKETIQEAKNNGFQEIILFIQSASIPFTETIILVHKLHILEVYRELYKKLIINKKRN